MPQGEAFWNPYRLIPARERIDRKPPLTDEKFRGKSGVIVCSLENLTPLFIGGNRNIKENFLTRDGRSAIPGASLKGMLRSLAEIVGGGCMVTDPKGQHSRNFSACDKANALCVACRMFGMMERGRNATVHKGNVSAGDALLREDKPATKPFQVLMSSCGTRHEPFYRSFETGKLDGKSRKLYFHQPKRTDSVPNVPEALRSRAWNIIALTPGHHFDFTVQFSNLRDEEFSLLVYALALENATQVEIGEEKLKLNGPMRHKIGSAKPLGMGSCRIKIEQITVMQNPAIRFSSLQTPQDTTYEGAALESEIAALTKAFTNDSTETMTQLRKMMVWDENDPRDFRYPDYHWFKSPVNSGKALKEI